MNYKCLQLHYHYSTRSSTRSAAQIKLTLPQQSNPATHNAFPQPRETESMCPVWVTFLLGVKLSGGWSTCDGGRRPSTEGTG